MGEKIHRKKFEFVLFQCYEASDKTTGHVGLDNY